MYRLRSRRLLWQCFLKVGVELMGGSAVGEEQQQERQEEEQQQEEEEAPRTTSVGCKPLSFSITLILTASIVQPSRSLSFIFVPDPFCLRNALADGTNVTRCLSLPWVSRRNCKGRERPKQVSGRRGAG